MSLSRAGVVAGLDMTTEGALTKLAYLLALPDSSPETVTKYMSISLRGELTESSLPVFRHPDGPLPERVQTLTAMAYAIAHGDLERVKTILKTEHHWLLNDADYSGNTPIVSEDPKKKRKNKFFGDCQIAPDCFLLCIADSVFVARPLFSTWRLLPLRFRFSTSCYRMVAPFTCAIAMDVPRCSWRRMRAYQSTSCCCGNLVLIYILMSDRRPSFWPGGVPESGV